PTTLTPPPTSPTVYTLTVTNGYGCMATANLTINPTTDVPIAGIDRSICLNSTTTLGSGNNITSPNITYSWSPAANLDNSNSPAPLFTPTSTGTFIYTVTKTDNSIGCSNFATVTITINSFSLPAITSPSICQNSCVQIGTIPVAGVTYSWSPSADLSNAAIANPIACAATTTETYTLTGISANGCMDKATILVIVNPIPAPSISIPTVTACLGTSNVIFNPVVTPTGTYNYLWSPNDGTLNNIYSDTPTVLLTTTGNKQYSLTVTDSATGCSTTATTSLITTACSVLSSVGDYVWFDLNGNGIQDANEPGVSGVTVTLYSSLGVPIASSITDANGYYLINNISPGRNYYIIFSRPGGYTFTLQDVGSVASTNNSKPDSTGQSNSFNLSANQNLTDIDAGIIPIATVLPITLVSFTGTLQNNEVVLNWQTAAEYDNSYFNVERSTDGIHFVVIGRVTGNGTSAIPHSYVYTDTQPADGTSFYRLEQVGYDGHDTYSDIIAITNNAQQKVNAYYDNQINAIMIIFKALQSGNVQFNLFADDGQLVKSLSAENILTQQLNTQGLSKGIYLLQIASNTLNYSQKIFIQ
ncbi:MAG TPA: SdrD B-like domain-containing protein, partial [Bacteroidia bacterium]|nr:SdrD B-like domain-containing protein [Bacteroidia bacterium]